MGSMITKAINNFLMGWAEKILDGAISACKYPVDLISHNIKTVDEWYGIFAGVAVALVVVVVLGRILMTILKQADESTDVTWANIVMDAIKSGASMPVMVFLQGILQGKVIYPLLKTVFSMNSKFTAKQVASLNKIPGGFTISGPLCILLAIFFAVVMVFFFVKMSIYYVEMMWFNITIPIVAVSIATETFDYGSTWWKKLIYYNITVFFQVLSLTFMVMCFENIGHGFWYLMGAIGFGVTTVRAPFVMDQFWSSTGITKAGTRNMIRSGSRFIGNKISRN